MPKGFRAGWLLTAALVMPATLLAQEGAQQASAQKVIEDIGKAPADYTPLPVTMDNNLPGESNWSANATLQPATATSAPVPESPAAAAMQVQPECNTCQPEEGGNARRLIRRLLDIPKQPWDNAKFFTAGQFSVEYVTGYFVSPFWVHTTHQVYFIPEIVRAGLMLTDPQPDRRLLRGSFEALAEFDCWPITSSAGNILIGGSGLLRYYPRPCKNQRYVAYVQAGFGGSYTDAYLTQISPTSSAFNFITQAGFGGHFFLTKRLAITSETNYYHISFPNQASSANTGFHIIGGTLGFTYFFNRDCSN